MIVLTIPEATPSLNSMLRMHWARKSRMRERWGWLVREARLEARARPRPTAYAAVTIERFGPKSLDHDNLVGGCKPILDALVKEGFLIDDAPTCLRVTYRQEIGEPCTRITIDSQLS